MEHSRATPRSFHLWEPVPSQGRFTLNMMYRSVRLGYLYTGQLYVVEFLS